jgi:hypothetical protein
MSKKRFEAVHQEPDVAESYERLEFYSNGVNVLTSLYDVTLVFQRNTPVALQGAGGPPLIETSGVCNVRMSPLLAKSLVAILIDHIIRYEHDNHLTLPLPPEPSQMQAAWARIRTEG